MSLCAYVAGIGVLGPGLPDWPAARAVLRGETAYVPAATVLPVSYTHLDVYKRQPRCRCATDCWRPFSPTSRRRATHPC